MADLLICDGNFALKCMSYALTEYQLLAKWLSDPVVLEYYEGRDRPYNLEMVQKVFSPQAHAQEHTIPCLMLFHDKPAGYLQLYSLDNAGLAVYGAPDLPLPAWGMDLFIGETRLWGQGLGTRFVRLALRYLFDQLRAEWILLDPHVENTRAIRCYEKCGFRRLKLLPSHELHEGKMVDCWVMGITRENTRL